MLYLYTKRHMPSFNDSLFTAIKPRAKYLIVHAIEFFISHSTDELPL
jgi:hypothetical protein